MSNFIDEYQNLSREFLNFCENQRCTRIFTQFEIRNPDIHFKWFGLAVYIQLRKDGMVYVGETVDLYARTMRHIELGTRIVLLGAIHAVMSDDERMDLETYTIGKAEESGFRLANTAKLLEGLERIHNGKPPPQVLNHFAFEQRRLRGDYSLTPDAPFKST